MNLQKRKTKYVKTVCNHKFKCNNHTLLKINLIYDEMELSWVILHITKDNQFPFSAKKYTFLPFRRPYNSAVMSGNQITKVICQIRDILIE